MPCLRLYSYLGCTLSHAFQPGDDHPYADWLNAYRSSTYGRLPAVAEMLLDELCALDETGTCCLLVFLVGWCDLCRNRNRIPFLSVVYRRRRCCMVSFYTNDQIKSNTSNFVFLEKHVGNALVYCEFPSRFWTYQSTFFQMDFQQGVMEGF